MTTEMKMKGNWQEAKGRMKEAWGDLTDDEMDRAEGNWDQLVGTIRQKTGEGVEEIEAKLNDIFDSVSGGQEQTSSG